MHVVKVLCNGVIPVTFSLADLQCGHICAVTGASLSTEKAGLKFLSVFSSKSNSRGCSSCCHQLSSLLLFCLSPHTPRRLLKMYC